MTAITVIISILLILACLALIVSVLLQSSNQRGLGAIAGEMTANMNKTQAASVEAKLALITKVAAVAFVVLALVMWVLPKNTTTTNAPAAPVVTEAPAETEVPAEAETEAEVPAETEVPAAE